MVRELNAPEALPGFSGEGSLDEANQKEDWKKEEWRTRRGE